MCTVTIVPMRAGHGGRLVRIACNRDEKRSRAPALPPRKRAYGDITAVMPIDRAAGGTWIAVNSAGLAMVLLNVSTAAELLPVRPVTTSRGQIIPSLIGSRSLEEAIWNAIRIDTAAYAPFKLLLVDNHQIAEVAIVNRRLRITMPRELRVPKLITSSSLGDSLVDVPRRALFHEFAQTRASGAWQQNFHRHSWLDRPHLSVCMSRAEACTVSYTTVELSSRAAIMHYHAGPPDQAAVDTELILPLRGRRVA